MKVSIDTVANELLSFNAGVKPRKDVNKTLAQNGFVIRNIALREFKLPYLNRLVIYFDFLKVLKDLSCNDEVIIQYPLFLYNKFLEFILLKKLCKKCQNVSFLIHDIDYLRSGNNKKSDTKLLNLPNRLIVHNEKMKLFVKESLLQNLNIEVKCLTLFDYYSEIQMISVSRILQMKSYIAFAGNLNKSRFIEQIKKISSFIDWNLYGIKGNAKIELCDNIHYLGKFSPDKPSILEAGWGLVWDGNSIETCNGENGEYLKYNSPHKLSLYLSRGIPIIVWKESALSGFVEKENIGVTVCSLYEIPEKILHLSTTDYEIIVNNARRIGGRIKKGDFLSSIIS